MVELDAFKSELNTYTEPLKEVRDSLDLENKVVLQRQFVPLCMLLQPVTMKK